ncbi:MAG: HlyD family efflux transporter periplasmic adaptor subunit, partial [Planctomycetales bacterium]|nr:HlyD family efflux transporter periplasmic adaptor subunit [Planctomycetales bacterium]
PAKSESVFVKAPGQLAEILVQAGDTVEADRPLVKLVNYDLQMSVADLQGQKRQREAELAGLRSQRVTDPLAARQIPAAQEALASIEKQLTEKETEIKNLTIKAPVAGKIIPAPSRPREPASGGRLPNWAGTSLAAENVGAWLDDSVQVCDIGDPNHVEALLVVDQGAVEFIQKGQKVRIKLDAYTGQTLRGELGTVAEIELDSIPASLSNQAGGTLATRTDAAGVQHPLSTSYLAEVALDDPNAQLLVGMRGRAKVTTRPQTLGQRLYRWGIKTFRFDL